MIKAEYLLTKLSEEAAEVIQAASKSLLFGLESGHPNRQTTNREDLSQEIIDLIAVVEMLQEEKTLCNWSDETLEFQKEAKKLKVKRYMEKFEIV